MKKWLIKQEWSKNDEEHIVGEKDIPTGEEHQVQEEANNNTQSPPPTPPPPPPPRNKRDLDIGSEFVYCGQDEPENVSSKKEEYGRKQEVDKDEPSRRKQFMHLFVPDAKPASTPQVWAGVTAAATHLGVGCALGLSTASIPLLTTNTLVDGDELHLNKSQAAFFSNMVVLGAAVGSLVTVVPQVWVGQRVTLLATLPISLAAWIMMVSTNNAWVVVAARALQGLTLGIMVGPTNNYVVELSHTNLRATLLAGLGLAEQLGWFVMQAAGTWALPWRWVALGCGCLSTVIPFAGLLFLPDSPRWLAFRDRPPEALKSLMFFRGPHYDSHEELTAIFNQVKKRGTARDQLRAMEDPNIINITLLLTLLYLASNFTGNVTLYNNMETILTLLGEGLSPTLSVVFLAAVNVIGSLIFLIIVERMDRRLVLAIVFLLCFGALAMLGSYFYDQREAVSNTPKPIWLPIISLAMFSFVSSSRMSVLILLREELLPTSVRFTAVGFLSALFYTGAFVAQQTYQPALSALEQHGIFWMYSCFNLLIAVTGGIALMETRGRSLEKIAASTHLQSNDVSQKKKGNGIKKQKPPIQRDVIQHLSSNGYHNFERGVSDINQLTHSPRRPSYVHRNISTVHQAVQTQDQATETHTDTVQYMMDGNDKIVILNLRNTYV
ncbi:hypothetical protein Pcinc_002442 [Petrolisthes cinctipes]|uniref:Major facilitator superfamily (MFS) profile domain-containing protein n=1 Tax=Petrolisthes cinctipes TaxID=88211 RepID=A0AAE1L2Z0_PETCI|nr:hypothetical protein Pcinc_002442 [Petrolisthes cinctipes]